MGKLNEAKTPKAYTPLAYKQLKDEAYRLITLYVNTFWQAPEANYLLKRSFFDYTFHKDYLQDNIFFVPRADYLWFFKYELGRKHGERTGERSIELKKRSACIDESEIELVRVQLRSIYTVEEGVADIIYTRYFAEDSGRPTHIVKNTIGAVALAEKLIADFTDDQVTGYGDF